METARSLRRPPGAVDAPTLTEALRRTAANHPDIVAVRWPDDSGVADLVGAAGAGRRGRRRARQARASRAGTRSRSCSANRPEFHIVDLAVGDARRDAVLDLHDLSARRDPVPDRGRGARRWRSIEQAFLAGDARGAQGAARARARDRRRRRGARGDDRARPTSRGRTPTSTPAARWREVEPDDVLTLIYTSGTTGPPKGVQLSHHNIMFAAKAIEEIITLEPGARVISWLPAAHIAERMAHHYIPIDLRGDDHLLPEPARDPLVPAAGPPDLVLRRAADLGEAQGRARDDARRPAGGAAQAGRGRDRRRRSAGPAAPARRAGAGRARGQVAEADEQMFSGIRAMLGLDQAMAVNVGAAPTPGRGARVLPRARDRAGGAVGDVGDLRGRDVQPPGRGQDRDGRAAGARASRSSSPRTARCSSAASS